VGIGYNWITMDGGHFIAIHSDVLNSRKNILIKYPAPEVQMWTDSSPVTNTVRNREDSSRCHPSKTSPYLLFRPDYQSDIGRISFVCEVKCLWQLRIKSKSDVCVGSRLPSRSRTGILPQRSKVPRVSARWSFLSSLLEGLVKYDKGTLDTNQGVPVNLIRFSHCGPLEISEHCIHRSGDKNEYGKYGDQRIGMRGISYELPQQKDRLKWVSFVAGVVIPIFACHGVIICQIVFAGKYSGSLVKSILLALVGWLLGFYFFILFFFRPAAFGLPIRGDVSFASLTISSNSDFGTESSPFMMSLKLANSSVASN
jgi:hypothetical protein